MLILNEGTLHVVLALFREKFFVCLFNSSFDSGFCDSKLYWSTYSAGVRDFNLFMIMLRMKISSWVGNHELESWVNLSSFLLQVSDSALSKCQTYQQIQHILHFFGYPTWNWYSKYLTWAWMNSPVESIFGKSKQLSIFIIITFTINFTLKTYIWTKSQANTLKRFV